MNPTPFEKLPNLPGIHTEQEQSAAEQERAELLIEAALMEGHKINEGKYGVIYQMEASHFSDEVKRYLYPDGGEPETLAGKILKIYHPIMGEHEADFQNRAYQANGQNQDLGCAKIPQVINYRDFKIKNEDLINKLNTNGVATNGQVCVILMDYVKGEDFSTYFYRRLLEAEEQESGNLPKLDLRGFEFPDLQRQVIEKFDLQMPTAEQRAEGLEFLVNEANAKFLIKYARKHNIAIDKDVFEKIRRTLKKIHQARIYHGDLHERNIMLEFNEQGEIIDVYLIDFGRAQEQEEEDNALSDHSFADLYEGLSLSEAAVETGKLGEMAGSLQSVRHYIQQNPRFKSEWLEYRKLLSHPLENGAIEEAYAQFENILGYLGNDFEKTAALLADLHKKHPEAVEELLGIVVKKAKQRPQFWIDFKKFLNGN